MLDGIDLFQALPETIRELKTTLWNAELTGGVANLTGALTTGFEILHRVKNKHILEIFRKLMKMIQMDEKGMCLL